MTKQLLRSASLLFIFNLSFITGKAQWVSIPDSNFGKWLNGNGYNQCLQGNSTLGWQMDTTCPAVVYANQFYSFNNNHITSLEGLQYFINLTDLCLQEDPISYIPTLPLRLYRFCLSRSSITVLPTLPDSLRELACTQNPNLAFAVLPPSLTSLFWEGNVKNYLPALPNSLTFLRCEGDSLTHLPNLPTNLNELYCQNNQLTSLPTLPDNLRKLYCSSNPLDSLPSLNFWLSDLGCDNCMLTYLPTLPNYLSFLSCNQNQLISLPELPNSLKYLYCGVNQLTNLPGLPNSMNALICNNNPNLHCLPELKQIATLQFDSVNVTCLPNYGNVSNSIPLLSTVPLCNPFNSNGCSVYWNINGKIYSDTSGNCIKDVGETIVPNMKVNLYQNGVLAQQNYSGGYGIYSFDTDMGTYTMSVDTTGVPFDILCPTSRFDTSVITTLDSFDYDKDFALQCKPGFDVGAWSLVSTGVFRPANMAYVNIHAGDWAEFWGQNCNTNNLSGQVVTTISGAATFVSAAAGALTPSVSGNTLTYTINNWSAVNPNTDFNIIVQTDTTAALGSQICFDVNVTPTNGDKNLSNNHLSHCFTVVGSYDPNIKEVFPVNDIEAGSWLTYTIHFQNSGTAEAQHIYVTDTLDSNVDASSFQLLDFSHPPKIEIKDKAVHFNFANINLPDSNANEALSHGYVQYRVKLKNNLPLGTNINNTAFIYLDFNSPVVTNTTSNTITTTTGIENFEFRNADFGLNPNPASESVRVSVDESMIGSNLTITDITGRKLLTVSVANSTFSISTAGFSSGVYFIRIGNETESGTKKLVVKQQ